MLNSPSQASTLHEPRTSRGIQAGFRKGRGTRDQIANICWIIEKARQFQKNIYFCPKPLCGSQQTVDNSSRDGKTRPPYLVFWETCMQVKKQQFALDMEQWTGSKLGKEHIKAIYCHPAYWTYAQSTSCKMLGWMKQKLESRLSGEISIISNMQMTQPLSQKAKRN